MSQLTKQQAEQAVKKYGSENKAVKGLGCTRWAFRVAIGKESAASVKESSTHAGKTLADFRALHDKDFIVPRKIKDGLRTMPGVWMHEIDFVRHAGVTLHDLGNYREQFAELLVVPRDGRKIWAKTAAVAEQMKVML